MKKPKPGRAKGEARRSQKVRYAVVGLGYISQIALLPAFADAANSEFVALVSDDPVRLQSALAARRGGLVMGGRMGPPVLRTFATGASRSGLPPWSRGPRLREARLS